MECECIVHYSVYSCCEVSVKCSAVDCVLLVSLSLSLPIFMSVDRLILYLSVCLSVRLFVCP